MPTEARPQTSFGSPYRRIENQNSSAKALALRQAPFALRVVQRRGGRAAIIYRRQADARGRDRLQRIAALSPLAFTAAGGLLREALERSGAPTAERVNAFIPLDGDGGARLACFGLLAAGLRDGERLARAADHLRAASGAQAAWWLGLLTQEDGRRALRALRILTEAVR